MTTSKTAARYALKKSLTPPAYSQLRPVMPGEVAAGIIFLTLPLEKYPRNAYLIFIVTNPQNGNRLRTLSLTNQPGEAAKSRLYAQPWLDAGLHQAAVDVTCRPVRGSVYTDHLLLPLSAPAY